MIDAAATGSVHKWAFGVKDDDGKEWRGQGDGWINDSAAARAAEKARLAARSGVCTADDKLATNAMNALELAVATAAIDVVVTILVVVRCCCM